MALFSSTSGVAWILGAGAVLRPAWRLKSPLQSPLQVPAHLVGANSFAMEYPATGGPVPAAVLSRLKPLPQGAPAMAGHRCVGPRCARRQPAARRQGTPVGASSAREALAGICGSEFIREGMSGHSQPYAGDGSFATEAAPTRSTCHGRTSLRWASLRSAPTCGTAPRHAPWGELCSRSACWNLWERIHSRWGTRPLALCRRQVFRG